ncbi:hypothetical protein F0L74_00340 [Chitinophaga agrisoli]|uniref:Uncharacterized protein n=1 Tax=Chitinophaga agrisoli TaxID=2607653 RepID=A0A5B2W1U3_9BACT|nr:hypothetical protein [Chitinophaga agrisoli]KAA2244466.1 hypothetical protein F0L74_00340 [Chitinophaga agrisoli]
MKKIVKQYQKELRNILLLALLVAVLPYLPQAFHFLETFTGTMLALALLSGCVLGLSLKLHYRLVIMRINRDNQ